MITDEKASVLMRDEFDNLGMVYICAILGQAQLLREKADAMTAGAKRLLQDQRVPDVEVAVPPPQTPTDTDRAS